MIRRATLLNLLLAAVSMAVVLVVLEGLARVALRMRGAGKEGNETATYMERDSHLGWKKRPGARVTYRRREYTTEVVVNPRGLRDAARPYQAAPGTFRALALGDSFVEAYSVRADQAVTHVAESALAAPGCPAEVLNAGTAGWSTDQEYLFYVEEGAKYAPQVVLLFFYYNDILGNTTVRYWGSPKPLLAVGADGRLVLTNDPVPRPPPAEPAPREAPRMDVKGSAAFAWVRERLARGAPRAYNALARLHLWRPLGGDTIERGDQLRVYKRRRQPEIEEAWTLTSAILTATARAAEAHGSRFAVVYIPSRMEVSDRDWDLTKLSYELDDRVWDRGLVARRVAEIGRLGGFPVLDLTPALREVTSAVREPYFQYDGHWNALGHEAAGRATADFLRRQGWVACGAGPARPRGRL